MKIDTLAVWHQMLENRDPSALDNLLAEDAVLISPVVHTPQRGKAITGKYLIAAMHVLVNEHFRYVREAGDEQGAILEFETEVDGISVNGVDLIKWNEDGQIYEFKVMVRPLQAVNKVHQKMGEQLMAHNDVVLS
ncbi:MAG: nuclear transport factor 2 family protein [Arenicella sp.]|nr:nuclear transport factor 2 family protein [Arenicella sp.]